MKNNLENLSYILIKDFINTKKENMERLSNEINNNMEKAKRLLAYQTIFNACSIPILIYYMFFYR